MIPESQPTPPFLIVIECCHNCQLHSQHSRHSSSQYLEHFEQLKTKLQTQLPNTRVLMNQPPVCFKRLRLKYTEEDDKYHNTIIKETVNYPRYGSFEVYAQGHVIFSKLMSGKWPGHERVVDIVRCMQEDKSQGLSLEKYQLENRLKNDSDQLFRGTYEKELKRKTKGCKAGEEFAKSMSMKGEEFSKMMGLGKRKKGERTVFCSIEFHKRYEDAKMQKLLAAKKQHRKLNVSMSKITREFQYRVRQNKLIADRKMLKDNLQNAEKSPFDKLGFDNQLQSRFGSIDKLNSGNNNEKITLGNTKYQKHHYNIRIRSARIKEKQVTTADQQIQTQYENEYIPPQDILKLKLLPQPHHQPRSPSSQQCSHSNISERIQIDMEEGEEIQSIKLLNQTIPVEPEANYNSSNGLRLCRRNEQKKMVDNYVDFKKESNVVRKMSRKLDEVVLEKERGQRKEEAEKAKKAKEVQWKEQLKSRRLRKKGQQQKQRQRQLEVVRSERQRLQKDQEERHKQEKLQTSIDQSKTKDITKLTKALHLTTSKSFEIIILPQNQSLLQKKTSLERDDAFVCSHNREAAIYPLTSDSSHNPEQEQGTITQKRCCELILQSPALSCQPLYTTL